MNIQYIPGTTKRFFTPTYHLYMIVGRDEKQLVVQTLNTILFAVSAKFTPNSKMNTYQGLLIAFSSLPTICLR